MRKLFVWAFELDQTSSGLCDGYWLFTSRKKAESKAINYFKSTQEIRFDDEVKFEYLDNTAQIQVDGICKAWILKLPVN